MGGAFTTTVTCWLAVRPPRSVTVAVTVCVPERSVSKRSVGPEPSGPSRLELHRIAASRLPSSTSLAVAVNVTAAPGTASRPSAGAVIVTIGRALTTTVSVALADLPPRSATDAVIVCVPERSRLTSSRPPSPRGPSRLDAQVIPPLRSPSSRSRAAPVSVTVSPGAKSAPSAGDVISSVGGAFTTTVISALARLLPPSVTEATMVCVPDPRLARMVPPPPSGPLRLELQPIDAVRSPSSTSLAEASSRTVSPGTRTVPSVGATIRTRGGAFTTTVVRACAVFPPLSVTEAVIVWVPERSEVRTSLPPLPSGPSRLELQVIAEVRSPSSASLAIAARWTGSPGATSPSAGGVIVTVGAAFTTMVRRALAAFPPRSLTEAVTVCVPERRLPTSSLAPVPSGPSRLDVHRMLALRLPSSTSRAVPAKEMTSPGVNVAPSAGARISTVGGAFTTTVSSAVARLPPASVTEAVMVCVPEPRLPTSSVPPVPRTPWRLDVQVIAAVRLPSSASAALPSSRTISPGTNADPSAGAMISSVGGAFTTMVARACAVLPPPSATVAVIACVPERSVVTVRLAPVPSTPSRLEAHEIAEPSAPSSASVAVPSRRTTSPGTKVDPSLGLAMATAGGAFTITVTSALAVFPPRSLTEARITCVPERSVPTASAPPVPSAPSRLDVHWMLALRLPSSASLAAAARRTSSPGTKLDPVVGAAIVTVGAAFTTTVIPAVARLPPASVTVAVIVCVPERSVATSSLPPVPSGPSRLERQAIAAVRFPSSRS